LVVCQINGDQEIPLISQDSRKYCPPTFSPGQALTATNPWSNLESPSLKPSATVLGCRLGVPSHRQGAGPVLFIFPPVLCIRACMRAYVHSCTHKARAFELVRGRYWSMMTEEDERKEEETKAANKAKRRKGGA